MVHESGTSFPAMPIRSDSVTSRPASRARPMAEVNAENFNRLIVEGDVDEADLVEKARANRLVRTTG